MKCKKCGHEEPEWIDVTKECIAKVKLTVSKNEMGYLGVYHKGAQVFSFDSYGKIQEYPAGIEDDYKVEVEAGGRFSTQYFKVFKRKFRIL